ncbi:iron-containing alcohol dehydrogenase [Alkalicoccus luteus]|uniref:iron-containing alcohol dehydrogenase n=1 Tax=Alkalicoccus luteus TaxID=1237094 RepID=UPI001FE6CF29|nr:iron-containing alcohol dehydrogenase [Alkalicoccus luteus]
MGYSTVHLPKSILYGENSFSAIGTEAAKSGSRVLLISDEVMKKLGYVEECHAFLREADVACTDYLGVASEPTDVYVAEALQLIQDHQCDQVIALGGGSCIDTAKAVAVLATNKGDISDYMGGKTLAAKAPLPLTAIPTTGGTGSEATDVTVITNTRTDVKMMIKQPAFMPEKAIVDPYLTVSSPKSITAATGVDALTHAVEAFISRKAHAFTDALALSAIKRIMLYLPKAFENGKDIEARDHMIYGSMQAGMAFSNSSVCLVHGMSRPIGALFHVPHGISNAMLLPVLLNYAKESCTDRLAEIGRYVSAELDAATDAEAADYVVSEILHLCEALSIPNLKAWGVEADKFQSVLDKMASDALDSGSPANNPKVPTKEEIIDLYKEAYDFQYASLQNQ